VSERLVPRWFAPVTVTFLALLTLFLTVTGALVDDGLMSRSMVVLGVGCGLLLVSACSAFLRRRRRVEVAPSADGSRVLRAPALTVWPLVGALVALYVVVAMMAVVAVTDFAALEAPGATLVAVAGAIAGLPDLLRLLTGRLHRWRIELGPDAFTYRGYRTDLTVPWSKVGRATIQQKSPAGVLVNVRGESKDPVLPYAAFAVPAEQLVEEIERAKAAARRRP
jgi:amino acid transporter